LKRSPGVVLGVLFAACTTVTPSPPSTGSPAPPTTAPSTTPAPTPSPTPLPSLPTQTAAHLRWTKTKTNLPPRIAHTGLHLAMRPVGSPRYVGIDGYNEAWLSDDGTTWTKVEKVGVGPWVNELFAFGARFIALGDNLDYMSIDRDGPYAARTAGYTWTTNSGRAWSTSPDPVAFQRAIVDGDRIVASGGVSGQYVPTFATSTDGTSWTTIVPSGGPWTDASASATPIPSPFKAPTGETWLPIRDWWSSVGLAGDRAHGYLTGVSHESDASSSCSAGPGVVLPTPADFGKPLPVIVRSTDLKMWTPVLNLIVDCSRVGDLVHGPAGFVAVVSTSNGLVDDGPEPLRMWSSRDGLTWVEASSPPRVQSYGRRELAIAPDGTFLDYGDEIWESTDGDHWFLSAPATNIWVTQVAGDLAFGCADETCYSLRIAGS
jgi:hypothetical protein